MNLPCRDSFWISRYSEFDTPEGDFEAHPLRNATHEIKPASVFQRVAFIIPNLPQAVAALTPGGRAPVKPLQKVYIQSNEIARIFVQSVSVCPPLEKRVREMEKKGTALNR